MNLEEPLMPMLLTVLAAVAYGAGAFHGQRAPDLWRDFFRSLVEPLSLRGFLWVAALPACWAVLLYSFIVHVRLALGRWPEFGLRLEGWGLALHEEALRWGALVLLGSLYVACVVLIVCLFLPHRRHASVYAAAYGVAVALAFGALLVAPGPFLNWFFD